MGYVEPRILNHLAVRITARLGLPCRILPTSENPQYAFNESRGQYSSRAILERLPGEGSPEVLRFLGVTGVDLFVPILRYVFGLAEVEGFRAIISTHRLRPEFYEESPNPQLLLARVEKTAFHELGHTFGLTHCRDRHCVMFSSVQIENTDAKGADFCGSCLTLLEWSLQRALSGAAP